MTDPTRRGRWAARLAVLALVVAASVLGVATPASAHAELVSTDPAEGAVLAEAPDQVTLTFSEPVRLGADAVGTYDAAGELDSDARAVDKVVTVDVPEDLAEGSYVVAWRVISADGHPVAGSLSFAVGAPSAVVEEPEVRTTSVWVTRVGDVVQGLMYVGLFVAAGLTAFACLLLPERHRLDRVRRQLRGTIRVATAVAGVAAAITVPIAGLDKLGEDFGDVRLVTISPDLVGSELLAAGLLVVGLALSSFTLPLTPAGSAWRRAPLAGAALAVISPAVVGHNRAYSPSPLLTVTDVLHVAAGAVWLGGLLGLILCLVALAGRERVAAELLSRFSATAAVLLGLVTVCGSLLAWRLVGSWDNLFGTAYGRLLLVKIGVAAVVGLVAAWNRFVLLPRAQNAVGDTDRRQVATLLRTAVGVEAALLVALLMVTGYLVHKPPRGEAATAVAEPTGVVAETAGELRVLAVMTPRKVGSNTLTVQLQDDRGEPWEPPAAPEVSVRSGSVDLGSLPLTAVDSGTYTASVVLPTAGTWEVQVSVKVSEFENPVTTLEIAVPE
ncbi:copper resistance protein CopC [Nocardioides speluncae]|uniref:copper resistance CopC/CopD family protein n=1 Tax=Nocardioides speluncae TaxID=2670337 RepID=UPI000D69B61E|nr:copper resistance protein CopC [Nocardioides speluncae]